MLKGSMASKKRSEGEPMQSRSTAAIFEDSLP